MTIDGRSLSHPSMPATTALRLYGRRVMLRPLVVPDFVSWRELRTRNEEWLRPWEPQRGPGMAQAIASRDGFAQRCSQRDRDRQHGAAFAFGLFADGQLIGEVNINNVQRGAQQCATIGYWIDKACAGNGFVAEGVAVALRFAFDELRLHRIEICIVPRNERSHRVVRKLGLRDEGTALRFLEINGVWEDHVRYAITAEEWNERREELAVIWFG